MIRSIFIAFVEKLSGLRVRISLLFHGKDVGQALAEYVFILSFVAMATVGGVTAVAGEVGDWYESIQEDFIPAVYGVESVQPEQMTPGTP